MRRKIEKILGKFTWIDWLLLGLLCSGLIYLFLFSLGLWSNPGRSVEYIAADVKNEQGRSLAEIWVDVSGAVEQPGVYQLVSGDRVKDALVAAGGLTKTADREFVSTTINLALKVKDGDKIYIPTLTSNDEEQKNVVLGTTSGRINLNKATTGELEDLPGIGAVRAKAIIDNRPYSSVDDLVTKKAVSQAVLDKIRDRVTVY